jgi:hypothetical protein
MLKKRIGGRSSMVERQLPEQKNLLLIHSCWAYIQLLAG